MRKSHGADAVPRRQPEIAAQETSRTRDIAALPCAPSIGVTFINRATAGPRRSPVLRRLCRCHLQDRVERGTQKELFLHPPFRTKNDRVSEPLNSGHSMAMLD